MSADLQQALLEAQIDTLSYSIEARAMAENEDSIKDRREYDQILQIDVSDDADPLSLGWNKGGECHQFDILDHLSESCSRRLSSRSKRFYQPTQSSHLV